MITLDKSPGRDLSKPTYIISSHHDKTSRNYEWLGVFFGAVFIWFTCSYLFDTQLAEIVAAGLASAYCFGASQRHRIRAVIEKSAGVREIAGAANKRDRQSSSHFAQP